jgi:hypothetical protein
MNEIRRRGDLGSLSASTELSFLYLSATEANRGAAEHNAHTKVDSLWSALSVSVWKRRMKERASRPYALLPISIETY